MNESCTIRSSAHSWDFENRLASVNLSAAGGTVSSQYDPFGRRIQKTTATGSTVYLYDGANIVAEVNASGAVVASYAQGAGVDEALAMRRRRLRCLLPGGRKRYGAGSGQLRLIRRQR